MGQLCVKESWTKVFVVGPLSYAMSPIGTVNKSHIFFRKGKEGCELVSFDISTQRIAEIGVTGNALETDVVIYNEYLLPFGGMSHYLEVFSLSFMMMVQDVVFISWIIVVL